MERALARGSSLRSDHRAVAVAADADVRVALRNGGTSFRWKKPRTSTSRTHFTASTPPKSGFGDAPSAEARRIAAPVADVVDAERTAARGRRRRRRGRRAETPRRSRTGSRRRTRGAGTRARARWTPRWTWRRSCRCFSRSQTWWRRAVRSTRDAAFGTPVGLTAAKPTLNLVPYQHATPPTGTSRGSQTRAGPGYDERRERVREEERERRDAWHGARPRRSSSPAQFAVATRGRRAWPPTSQWCTRRGGRRSSRVERERTTSA